MKKHDTPTAKKPPVSYRFYLGYTIRNNGYYPPDKCLWWEAVNEVTGEADFHAKRLKDVVKMINEALAVSPNGQQTDASRSALRLLNYVKKHNCRIRMRWYCGIQIHRVWKNEKELSYPIINEDTWCEISHLFKQDGDYQQTHFYDLHCG